EVRAVSPPPSTPVVKVIAPPEPDPGDVLTPVVPIRADILTSVDVLPGALPPARPAAEPPAARPGPARPRLAVPRGARVNMEYSLAEGPNYIGRTDDQPVDIDLVCQEAADRVWASRKHAVIRCRRGELSIEDLHSLNGTFVNRKRIVPGQPRPLRND